MLNLYAPTSQNGQTHTNNSSAVAAKLSVLEHFVGLAFKGLKICHRTSPKSKGKTGVISTLDNYKATRVINIPIKILKLAKESKHLFQSIWFMLCNRYISWEFKNCSGSTSLQKGFWTIDQYRPTFLLSNLYKIFGKLMHQRLLVFLKSQKVMYKNNLGIKKNYLLVLE